MPGQFKPLPALSSLDLIFPDPGLTDRGRGIAAAFRGKIGVRLGTAGFLHWQEMAGIRLAGMGQGPELEGLKVGRHAERSRSMHVSYENQSFVYSSNPLRVTETIMN